MTKDELIKAMQAFYAEIVKDEKSFKAFSLVDPKVISKAFAQFVDTLGLCEKEPKKGE